MMKSWYLRCLPSEKISFRVSNETSEAMSLNSGGITISSIRKIEGLPLASLPFIFTLMIFLSLDENERDNKKRPGDGTNSGTRTRSRQRFLETLLTNFLFEFCEHFGKSRFVRFRKIIICCRHNSKIISKQLWTIIISLILRS